MIVSILAGVCSFFLHEIGHYLVFRACKVKPTISLNWVGVHVGTPAEEAYLTPRELLAMLMGGIVLGTLPLLWGVSSWLYYTYFFLILADLGTFFSILHVPRHYWRRPYKEYLIDIARGFC